MRSVEQNNFHREHAVHYKRYQHYNGVGWRRGKECKDIPIFCRIIVGNKPQGEATDKTWSDRSEQDKTRQDKTRKATLEGDSYSVSER